MGNKEILNRSPGKLCEEIILGINEKMLLTRAERELGGWVGGTEERMRTQNKFPYVFHWSVF